MNLLDVPPSSFRGFAVGSDHFFVPIQSLSILSSLGDILADAIHGTAVRHSPSVRQVQQAACVALLASCETEKAKVAMFKPRFRDFSDLHAR